MLLCVFVALHLRKWNESKTKKTGGITKKQQKTKNSDYPLRECNQQRLHCQKCSAFDFDHTAVRQVNTNISGDS
jgi:hypothetical protein